MTRQWMRLIGSGLLILAAAVSTGAATPSSAKRVLILHSYGPDFGDELAKDLRAELGHQIPGQLDLYENWLVSARFRGEGEDAAFANYLSALFADHPLDLIITLGGPAANFVERYQKPVFRNIPVLLTDVDARRVSAFRVPTNEAAVAHSISLNAIVVNILRLLPQTTTLALVIGNTPTEKYWVGQVRETLRSFNNHITLISFDELPFDEVLKRAATLPPRSAILFGLLSRDLPGIPGDEDTVVTRLHAVADAPIFTYLDAYFGEGVVGGPMISYTQLAHEAGNAAAHILDGQNPTEIKVTPIGLANPKYDWRELQRWGIRESDLPPGSSIRFREPSAWERYRWQIVSAASLIVLEGALIAALLYQRRRRRIAEVEAHQRMAELAHMNRRATVGELSASLAHELNQPLSGIVSNTQVARSMLEASPAPNLTAVDEILTDVAQGAHRATEVIRRLRRLLTKAPVEAQQFDLNEVVREVCEFLAAQALAQHVTLSASLAAQPLLVSADRVQLQQVILNLVMNAIEAIRGANSLERAIVASTSIAGDSAQVAIADTGPGIPLGREEEIFAPFFTTKQTGMGMGLSIARRIVASYGGRIWTENQPSVGAVFRFALPLVKSDAAVSAVSPDQASIRQEDQLSLGSAAASSNPHADSDKAQ